MRGPRLLLLAAIMFAAGATGLAAADVFHFALSRSAPAADATVSAPEEVRLWFTQAPQDNSVSVRLVDSTGEAVETTPPAIAQDDAKVAFVKPSTPLAEGSYTVSWRGIGDDGHVVRGDFGFSVSAQ